MKQTAGVLPHDLRLTISEDSLIGEVIKRWGAERILSSSDYPHPDTPWPEGVAGMQGALAGFSSDDEQGSTK